MIYDNIKGQQHMKLNGWKDILIWLDRFVDRFPWLNPTIHLSGHIGWFDLWIVSSFWSYL